MNVFFGYQNEINNKYNFSMIYILMNFVIVDFFKNNSNRY